MPTRRAFLQAGGLALAGLAFPAPVRRALLDGVPAAGGGPDRAVTIRMRSDARGGRVWFDPVGLLVAPGTTVRWLLEANVHSATAYHPANGGWAARIPTSAAPWDSGLLTEPGQAFDLRLDHPGVYDYFCLPHELAGMVGRIVVAAPGARAADLPSFGPATEGQRPPSVAALATFPDVARILHLGSVPPGP